MPWRSSARSAREFRSRVVVEDPDRPLGEDAVATGSATITVDEPERVEVETASGGPSYLVLADTYDPGWSATVDGRPAPIRPAFVAFRAVALPAGSHRVEFTYRPAGFTAGLIATAIGVLASIVCLAWPRPVADLASPHAALAWPRRWPLYAAIAIVALAAGSAIRIGPDGAIGANPRVQGMFHTFTWGAGIEAIPETRDAVGR